MAPKARNGPPQKVKPGAEPESRYTMWCTSGAPTGLNSSVTWGDEEVAEKTEKLREELASSLQQLDKIVKQSEELKNFLAQKKAEEPGADQKQGKQGEGKAPSKTLSAPWTEAGLEQMVEARGVLLPAADGRLILTSTSTNGVGDGEEEEFTGISV